MLHAGLDLSRTRLDVHVMDQTGTSVAVTTAAPDVGGLASLAYRLGEFDQPVAAGPQAGGADAAGPGTGVSGEWRMLRRFRR